MASAEAGRERAPEQTRIQAPSHSTGEARQQVAEHQELGWRYLLRGRVCRTERPVLTPDHPVLNTSPPGARLAAAGPFRSARPRLPTARPPRGAEPPSALSEMGDSFPLLSREGAPGPQIPGGAPRLETALPAELGCRPNQTRSLCRKRQKSAREVGV